MIDAACALGAVVVMLVAFAVSPVHDRCPPGWWVDGVRPSGEFDCRPTPDGSDELVPGRGLVDHSVQPPGVLDGRIFCGAGTEPRVVDARTVACRRIVR